MYRERNTLEYDLPSAAYNNGLSILAAILIPYFTQAIKNETEFSRRIEKAFHLNSRTKDKEDISKIKAYVQHYANTGLLSPTLITLIHVDYIHNERIEWQDHALIKTLSIVLDCPIKVIYPEDLYHSIALSCYNDGKKIFDIKYQETTEFKPFRPSFELAFGKQNILTSKDPIRLRYMNKNCYHFFIGIEHIANLTLSLLNDRKEQQKLNTRNTATSSLLSSLFGMQQRVLNDHDEAMPLAPKICQGDEKSILLHKRT